MGRIYNNFEIIGLEHPKLNYNLIHILTHTRAHTKPVYLQFTMIDRSTLYLRHTKRSCLYLEIILWWQIDSITRWMSSRLPAQRFTAVIGQGKIRIFRKFVRYLLLILDFKPFIEININLEEEKKKKKKKNNSLLLRLYRKSSTLCSNFFSS